MVNVLNCKYSLEGCSVRIPVFESQRFFINISFFFGGGGGGGGLGVGGPRFGICYLQHTIHFILSSLRQIVSYDCFIGRNNSAYNFIAIKELIGEGVRGIAPGDWVKCVEHVLSVERV